MGKIAYAFISKQKSLNESKIELTNMENNDSNIIIYNTIDGRASVVLYARDGSVWMNQNQLAELFDTSVPNVSMHINNILKEGELQKDSVIKNYLTTASDGKKYEVIFYSLEMIDNPPLKYRCI